MRWDGNRESSNVEDRRGAEPGSAGGMGGLGGMGVPRTRRAGGFGLGTIVIALVVAWLFGINPLSLLGMFDGGPAVVPTQQAAPPAQRSPPSAPRPGQARAPADELGRFVSVVLASTEDSWSQVFQRAGSTYRPPKLVIYSGRTGTACGLGSAAAGPFYCPGDQTVYIDLRFYQLMRDRLGAPGDFAQAYVIAHEVGHHIQNLVGTMGKVEQARQRMSERDYNQISVRLELQADCYAGVWAHHSQQAKGWLERGDIEEAMNAAAAVGDDNMMRQSQGVVVPEAFTHGSSQQRARWFRIGLDAGRVEQCDTFSARTL